MGDRVGDYCMILAELNRFAELFYSRLAKFFLTVNNNLPIEPLIYYTTFLKKMVSLFLLTVYQGGVV